MATRPGDCKLLGEILATSKAGSLMMRVVSAALGAVGHAAAQKALVGAVRRRISDAPALTVLVPVLATLAKPGAGAERILRRLASSKAVPAAGESDQHPAFVAGLDPVEGVLLPPGGCVDFEAVAVLGEAIDEGDDTGRADFRVDALACPRPGCSGRLRLIAAVTDPDAIRRILEHLDLPSDLPALAPARDPPIGP